MRVFVCEFVTGGGMRAEPLPASLSREGAMMRDALAADLSDLGVEVRTTHDDRLRPVLGADSVPVCEGDDAWALWETIAKTCDVAWVVAPETGGLLGRLTDLVRRACPVVVGPNDEAIRIASSKSLTAKALAGVVPTPPVWRAHQIPRGAAGPFVIKPDDGAGCEATRLVATAGEARDAPPGSIVQPFIAGEPASLTVLGIRGGARLLAANRQRIVVEGGAFRFRGVAVGAIEDADGRLAALAGAVTQAIPGLAGIFGIDLVIGAEGSVVIEVNPRLTTAYSGLRDAIGENPAALVSPFGPGVPSAARRAVRQIEIAL